MKWFLYTLIPQVGLHGVFVKEKHCFLLHDGGGSKE